MEVCNNDELIKQLGDTCNALWEISKLPGITQEQGAYLQYAHDCLKAIRNQEIDNRMSVN